MEGIRNIASSVLSSVVRPVVVQKGALLNQKINESDLADNIYLITEEGYLMAEQTSSINLFISED